MLPSSFCTAQLDYSGGTSEYRLVGARLGEDAAAVFVEKPIFVFVSLFVLVGWDGGGEMGKQASCKEPDGKS